MSIIQSVILLSNALLIVGALGLWIICVVLLVECIAALFPVKRVSTEYDRQNAKLAVLIPAHNEEVVIGSTLQQLLPAIKQQDRLVVIADNCSDRTATIAREAGATVIERDNPNLRGKGYALDYGLRFLESDPPEVVVLVDADCKVTSGAIEHLTKQAIATRRPVQALYLMKKPSNPSSKDLVSVFAFKVKNLVRPLGLTRLSIPILLTGTGMAFPWSVISSVNLATGNIVEDMKLGLDLSIAGHKPLFCPDAKVSGELPQQTAAAKSQRTRWEHGHLQTLLTYAPILLKAGVTQKRFDLLGSALDLCIPPLSLLVVSWLALFTTSVGFGIITGLWIPATMLTTAGFCLSGAILIAWAKFARSDLPLKQLLTIPFYILWKVPLYFRFLFQREKNWVRTERDSVKPADS
jgi:cellulose synthase/poly-beta-1,6-N-acetylglucosamine synthase-like glycosyltransferase